MYKKTIMMLDQQNIDTTPMMTGSELKPNPLAVIAKYALIGALIGYRGLVSLTR